MLVVILAQQYIKKIFVRSKMYLVLDLTYLVLDYFHPLKLAKFLTWLNNANLNHHYRGLLRLPRLVELPLLKPGVRPEDFAQIVGTSWYQFQFYDLRTNINSIINWYTKLWTSVSVKFNFRTATQIHAMMLDIATFVQLCNRLDLQDGDVLRTTELKDSIYYYYFSKNQLIRIDDIGAYSQSADAEKTLSLPINALDTFGKYAVTTIDQLQLLYPFIHVIGIYVPVRCMTPQLYSFCQRNLSTHDSNFNQQVYPLILGTDVDPSVQLLGHTIHVSSCLLQRRY